MQTRTMSIIEVTINYTLGFGLAWALAYYVLPVWGFNASAAAATEATALFTLVSVVRSYACRRIFNHIFQRPGVELMNKLRSHVNAIVQKAHGASTLAGWWKNTDIVQDRHVVPAKLCLIHSEISEAMEGHRKDLMDDKLPHRKMVEVELADAVIRIADLAGAMGLDLGAAVDEKMAFNAGRPDHKLENRAAVGGKSY